MKRNNNKQVFYIRIKELREAFAELAARRSSRSLSNSDSECDDPRLGGDHDGSKSDVRKNSEGDKHPFFE